MIDPKARDTRRGSGWHGQVFFGIHYDLHAGAADTDLGRDLTHEHLRERLLRVRPDWIQCDCKGHAGYTGWPTEVGSPSPGIVKDALRIHRDVTRELGIFLGMHYSGVWDTRAVELHPDWGRIDEHGAIDFNATCRLSGYDQELMIPQMLELIERYDVDGFWVDGENWASGPCWCERCCAEFSRRAGIEHVPRRSDEPHWAAWLAFHRDLFVEHVSAFADAIHARKPECQVCSNWMYTVRQPEPIRAPVDYLSGDYDWSWGAERAAVEGRLLDSRGMTWDLMAWAFTKTGTMEAGPPWTLKTETHLCQELAEVVALGGAVMVYNQPQRSGWIPAWHQDLIAAAAEFCRARKDACFQSQTLPQAAILHLTEHYYAHNSPLFNPGEATQPLEGALHALLELHRSVDVLAEDAALDRMSAYRLVVIPEQLYLTPALVAALESYAIGGGCILLSGPHLTHACADLVGARPLGAPVAVPPGPDAVAPSYLPLGDRAVSVNGPWQPAAPEEGTEVWLERLTNHDPVKDRTGEAVVTCRRVGAGIIVAIHGELFRDYYRGHYPLARQLIGALIDRMGIRWAVEVEGPPRLELVLRQRDETMLINLINRGAGEALSPRRVIVDELPPITDIVLRVPRGTAPTTVQAVPSNTPLAWDYSSGMLALRVPRLDIHTVIAVR